MQKMPDNSQNATPEAFFKFMGAVVLFLFSALFFFLKLLASSRDSSDNEDSFGLPTNYLKDDYDDLTSTSPRALTNPLNMHNLHNSK